MCCCCCWCTRFYSVRLSAAVSSLCLESLMVPLFFFLFMSDVFRKLLLFVCYFPLPSPLALPCRWSAIIRLFVYFRNLPNLHKDRISIFKTEFTWITKQQAPHTHIHSPTHTNTHMSHTAHPASGSTHSNQTYPQNGVDSIRKRSNEFSQIFHAKLMFDWLIFN